MSNFFVSLWESVFQPGTNPALITATHGSFVFLTLSLIWMVFTTGSIHFVNLLIIALCLWASVTWFLHELEKEKGKLKTNEELAAEAEKLSKDDSTEIKEDKKGK
ncbi:hypothetical protein CANINC_001616 [Pichia inconspicua]|uniref:Uncharacterized protein n=1 Tax=Pichia inconspicua TaxID=52247 RepID=A0A4T0X382_9ASCO|nr:hypothetical protein CANINC_001616 [[Candida] inconspicua]